MQGNYSLGNLNMKYLIILVIFATLICKPAIAVEPLIDLSDVGEVSLENSGAPEAQQAFLHGLAQLHSFEYGAAAEDFIKAQEIDPSFALAYWGEAMTYDHPIWHYARPDRKKALAALNRYAPTPAGRQSRAPSDMARDLLAAVDILYGAGDEQSADDRYKEKMAGLYAKYPDNVEIASFYALSIMGSAHDGRDFALYMQAAAIMWEFINDYPKHPGVAHYLIHSTDDSIHAPLGLRAAQAYENLAPNAPHAQHMTTHIYLALGMWEGVIRGGIRATELGQVRPAPQGKPCGHYPQWLMYGYLQVGQFNKASALMNRCYEVASNESPGGRRRFQTYAKMGYAKMRTLYLLDTGDWQGPVADMKADLTSSLSAVFNDQYLNGLIALHRGDVSEATMAYNSASKTLVALNKSKPVVSPSSPEIQLVQLMAQITLFEGKEEEGLSLLREAVELELTLPLIYGPPEPQKPSLELLGETLLKVGKPEEAHEVLTKALSRTKGKALTIAALAAAGNAMSGK
jgi:tetratricopeptide (TPR) repeat protein